MSLILSLKHLSTAGAFPAHFGSRHNKELDGLSPDQGAVGDEPWKTG